MSGTPNPQRIMDDPGHPRHLAAMQWMNALVLDLKKQLLEHEHEPITIERLNQFDQHYRDLEQCRDPMKLY